MQLIYLFLSLYYGRRNTLFYLIFPIAMVSGYGALIDPRTVVIGADIFTQSNNVYKDVVVLYLFVIYFFINTKADIPFKKTKPFVLMSAYIVFSVLHTLLMNGLSYDAINVIRLFTNMVIGFYLILAIFSTASQRDFIQFLNMLFYSTGILSILYTLNSAHIFQIYYKEILYQEVEYGTDIFYRDFSTIPYFSHLLFIMAISEVILKSHIINRKAIYFSLLTYPFVLLFTFTRNLLVVILMESLIILIIISIKDLKFLFNKRLVFLCLGIISMLFTVRTIFSSQYEYFNSRIEVAKNEGKNDGNFAVRIAYHIKAYNILKKNKALIIGDGMNKKNDNSMSVIGAWTADSTIPFWLMKLGLIGVIIFYYICFYFWRISFKQISNNPNSISIALFATITLSTFISLLMGGYRWGDPLIFFPYVLVLFLSTKPKAQRVKIRLIRKLNNVSYT